MIGVVIVAHGRLAQEYLHTIEHVYGQQPNIIAVSIDPECDRPAKQDEICAAADSVDTGNGVVVVTDMFGGSPSNLSMKACNCAGRQIMYGANVPMLLKLVKSRSMPIADALAVSLSAGRKYINSCGGSGGI